MWLRTYLAKLVQHVLPGDTHVLQHEVPVVDVLKIHFGTDVSCNYACSGRKRSLLTSTWTFFSPFFVRLGMSKEGHVQLCFFPSVGDLAWGDETGIQMPCGSLFQWSICYPRLPGSELSWQCRGGQSSPGFWVRRRLGLDVPEGTLNLPLDKKVGVNDNYALCICLGLVLAITTLSLGPMF